MRKDLYKVSYFKYIIFSFFLATLSLLHGEVWTDCNEAFEQVEIVAQNVTLPSPAEIDYKAGLGKEFREALGNRPDINWNAVQDNYREWSEHTTTLSGPARMLVACVLTAVTNGMGSKWFAAHGIAEGTATHAALSAGIQAVVVGAGTSLAGNLGDIGKTFDELTSADFIKNIASTMLTAGISQSLSTSLQLPDKPESFKDALKTNATHGLVRTGVDSAIYGGKVGKNLAQTMTTAAVDAGAAQVAHKIGDGKHSGALNPITHKAAHGTLAVAGAKLTGRDPVGAAIGAVAGEIAAERLHEEGKDPSTTAAQARIIGDTVAFLSGRDVASADSAGSNAIENNWLWTLPDVYHYGNIYLESGKEGVIEEIKEHPIEAVLAVTGFGFIGRIGKGAKVVGKLAKAEKLEQKAVQTGKTVTEAKQGVRISETAINAETRAKDLSKIGRQGKEKRLVEISEDWRTGKSDKGWIIQEQNHAKRGGRGMSRSKALRNPPGKVLAHKRGKEAAKGFDYRHADLQEIELHKAQHKYDNFGKKNK